MLHRPSRTHHRAVPSRTVRGFTLLELMVVLAILGALVALAAPRTIDLLDRSKVKAQAANLQTLRATLDAFYGDQGRWPDSLEELVERRYLRSVPVDPVTDRAEWVLIAPPAGQPGKVWDVRSPSAISAPSGAPAAPDPPRIDASSSASSQR